MNVFNLGSEHSEPSHFLRTRDFRLASFLLLRTVRNIYRMVYNFYSFSILSEKRGKFERNNSGNSSYYNVIFCTCNATCCVVCLKIFELFYLGLYTGYILHILSAISRGFRAILSILTFKILFIKNLIKHDHGKRLEF